MKKKLIAIGCIAVFIALSPSCKKDFL
ncbi:MAG: hypothetical protein JWQ85_3564, partial [Mucilaginibacter sp.]|nr:hypothetical protein [Mucilaginibacter sp.]